MSIEVTATKDVSSIVSQQQHSRWLVLLRSPLWLCLLLALIVRVWLVVHTGGYFQSDEAFIGIQAQHILQGERPIYYYGQPYMGSLEAYLMAIIFAIAGSSRWTLRAEPIVLSLVLVWLTWKLAAALAAAAHLPLYAQRRFMFIAALCAALPPLYDAVTELRTLGGYIETFVLMLLLLLSALRLTQRWHLGASSRELAWRWAGIGFIVGLGLWIDPLIISAVLAAALWIVGYCTVALVKLRRHSTAEPPHPALSLFKKLLLVITAIPASLIGFAPAIYWGASSDHWDIPASRGSALTTYMYYWGPRQWANITYVLKYGSGTSTSDLLARLPLIHAVADMYRTCIAPRVIGGGLPEATVAAIHPRLFLLGLGIGIVCILGTSMAVGLSFFWPHPLLVRIRQLASLPLLFGGCTAFIFCVSKPSAGGLPYVCSTTDAIGRYATPLALALPFLLAAIFTVISMYLQEKGQRPPQNTEGMSTSVHPPFSLVLSRPRLSRVMQTALFALLLVYLGVQGYSYVRMNARYAIEVFFCHNLPADNGPIIAYMHQQHIHYAWANWALAAPIVFESNGSIIATDPRIDYPIVDRLPAQTDAIIHADRPSVLTLVLHADPYPQLLKTLDFEQVTYRVARFPSAPGVDLLVVTPLSRTISPFESNPLSPSAEEARVLLENGYISPLESNPLNPLSLSAWLC